MKFSKQIKSFDRRLAPLRRISPLLNKIYNHALGVNVDHSFHSTKKKKELKENALTALNELSTPFLDELQTSEIPKIIWIYWDTGFMNAPDVVKKSVLSWTILNPDYEVRCLTNDNLDTTLGFNFDSVFQLSTVHCLPAIKADLIRLYLLSKHGGVWADATTFCLISLSSWLPEAEKCSRIFTFKHKYNASRPIEVWFIAAPKNTTVIHNTLNILLTYIFSERPYTLFISGKLSLLRKTHTGTDVPQDITAMKKGELLGFMPYFSTGYAFYTALKNENEDKINKYLSNNDLTTPQNQYALTNDTFDTYKNSLVSKQTYTSSYIRSKHYRDRLHFLSNLIRK